MNPEVLSSSVGLTPEELAALERDLSVRAVFERMIVASLKGAALCGAAALLIGAGVAAADGAGFPRFMSVAIGSLSLACVVFFGGFIGAIVAGVPLFLLLERAKVRRGPPYVLAALLVNAVIYVVLMGAPPGLAAPAEFLFLLPGPLVAVIFLRAMARSWRGADPGPRGAEIVRLH